MVVGFSCAVMSTCNWAFDANICLCCSIFQGPCTFVPFHGDADYCRYYFEPVCASWIYFPNVAIMSLLYLYGFSASYHSSIIKCIIFFNYNHTGSIALWELFGPSLVRQPEGIIDLFHLYIVLASNSHKCELTTVESHLGHSTNISEHLSKVLAANSCKYMWTTYHYFQMFVCSASSCPYSSSAESRVDHLFLHLGIFASHEWLNLSILLFYFLNNWKVGCL